MVKNSPGCAIAEVPKVWSADHLWFATFIQVVSGTTGIARNIIEVHKQEAKK
jgi:hypothetical protein